MIILLCRPPSLAPAAEIVASPGQSVERQIVFCKVGMKHDTKIHVKVRASAMQLMLSNRPGFGVFEMGQGLVN